MQTTTDGAMTDEDTIESAKDLIRATLKARSKQLGFTNRSRDRGVHHTLLAEFIANRLILSTETISAISKDLFNADFDPDLDLLRPLTRSREGSAPARPPPASAIRPGHRRSIRAPVANKTSKPGWI